MRANRVLKMAVAYTLAAASSMALAQNAPPAGATTELETVIVTGTYIKGTAEDAALPVDVITSEDLAKQGSPTMTELVKSIPSVQGVFGESNQFATSQGAGTSNINLRGLGAARTLVLLNGKRLSNSPAVGVAIDTNLLPVAAIGRLEVLKDGAAATYGSDAIGGVVNFITKDRLDGLTLDGSYSHIDGSDGDYNANAAWGWQGDSSSVLLAAGYRHRSMLATTERDWALQPILTNPQSGWSSFSNPGRFVTYAANGTTVTGAVIDPACTALGGTLPATCNFQYSAFDNLVEEEDHYNVFAEYKLEISDAFKVRAEALWAMHDVPEEHTSPSYGPNQGPNGGAPDYFIPLNNPGLVAYLALPSTVVSAGTVTNINNSQYLNPSATGSASPVPGIRVTGLQWRPFATGGNPAYGGNGALLNSRKFDGFRVAFGLSGDVGDLFSWDVGATYGENGSEISTPDFLVSRLQQALSGFGGPNCSGATPGANGCEWLNPLSTGIERNRATGAYNNVTYAGINNSAALARWLQTPNSYESTTTLVAIDAVLNGEFGFLSLPGGNVGWAAGAQYRDSTFELVVTDPYADGSLYPCGASPINPAATCPATGGAPRGALSFYGVTQPVDVAQDVLAGFAEFSFPILDSLTAQVAVRYENYGDPVGSTTNPKLSLRYQPIDALTFRGSYGSTFRAPPQNTLSGTTTFLFFTPQAGGFRPYDTVGNPNLKPETADTFNVGFIVKLAGFTGSVDYWSFDFQDALTTDVGTQLVTAFFTPYDDDNNSTTANAPNRCNDAAYDQLQNRFTFTGGVGDQATCGIANLLRTRVNQINAQTEVKVSGIDFSLSYAFDNVIGGELTVAADGTYNLEYKLGDSTAEGILIDPATDAIGTRGGRAGSQAEWKGSAYLNYSTGDHNLRVTSRYVSGLEDKYRPATFAATPTLPAISNGAVVSSFLTYDIAYNVALAGDVSFNLAVINVTDKDPPFARLDLNYDPFVANPLGRVIKLGVGAKF